MEFLPQINVFLNYVYFPDTNCITRCTFVRELSIIMAGGRDSSVGKSSASHAGDTGSNPTWELDLGHTNP